MKDAASREDPTGDEMTVRLCAERSEDQERAYMEWARREVAIQREKVATSLAEIDRLIADWRARGGR